MKINKERWSSRTGVILAVIGSAVGLANFLRFPGQAAQFGGGAFMLAYFLSLVVVALPVAWAEWTMGRYGGQKGYSACPGIFYAIKPHRLSIYLGILGVLIPLVIYMYYSYIGSWCLGYAINFISGKMTFSTVWEAENFWSTFIGASSDGSALGFGIKQVGVYLIITFLLIFTLIYKGISKGIELFARVAVPTLIILALLVLLRVLTLGAPLPDKPERNIKNGLGFLWNPTKTYLQSWNTQTNEWENTEELIGKTVLEEKKSFALKNPTQYRIYQTTIFTQLKKPSLWLAAASQVFFSLSVGFGLVITYASYMKKDDDVVLSSLTASSANEFCEVGIGGLMSLPAAYAFLGAAGVVGQTTFALGFKVLPMVFSQMPLGNLFGSLFFLLLFLASINGSISCLQPSIAFMEETLLIKRRQSVAIVGMITALGCGFVVWFSKDAKALSTLDFWVANLLVLIIATTQIIFFGWVLGIEKGFEQAHKGASIKIPNFFKFIIKYLCPIFLITITLSWVATNLFGLGSESIDPHVLDLIGTKNQPPNPIAWACIAIVLVLYVFLNLIASRAPSYNNKFSNQHKNLQKTP